MTITPAQRDQAPLAITFTLFPGLYLRAGAWHDFALPACGCDACDEDAEYVLRELAENTEALTAGRLSERITGRPRAVLEFSWEGDDWSRRGMRRLSVADVNQLRARPVQPPADGNWRPRRRAPAQSRSASGRRPLRPGRWLRTNSGAAGCGVPSSPNRSEFSFGCGRRCRRPSRARRCRVINTWFRSKGDKSNAHLFDRNVGTHCSGRVWLLKSNKVSNDFGGGRLWGQCFSRNYAHSRRGCNVPRRRVATRDWASICSMRSRR
ncbi:DUF6226 family protein [Rhodococcus sp. ACS1]|uniref:DUF6226 family protein n=1 Tax=Rhodococcus sp. ACS1 TaxID=2028570 RepID=UPI00359C501E